MSAANGGVEAYVAATANEIFFDDVAMEIWRLHGVVPAAIPRPLQAADLARRHPRLLRLLVWIILRLWPLPLQPMLVASCSARYLVGWLLARARHPGLADLGPDVALCATSRMPSVLARVAEGAPGVWLTLPWVPVATPPPGIVAVPLLRLARLGDLAWAAREAWRGAREIARRHPGAGRLQGYTALPWMLLWRVLSRHEGKLRSLWFANHYDRWAVLCDRLPGDFARVLLQHGFFYDGSMPTRLARVRRIFAFGPRFERQFRRGVLTADADVTFTTMPLELALTPPGGTGDGRRSLLIIGLPPHAEKQCRLVRSLVESRPDLRILVKPHPLYDSSPYRTASEGGAELIGGNEFPRVDLALADQSWLGVEYEASGIDVLWHLGLDVEGTLAEVDRRLPRGG